MAEKIQTLQEKIEERAKARLNDDLYNFSESIRSSPFSRADLKIHPDQEKLIRLQLAEPEEGGRNEPRDLYNMVYASQRGSRTTYMDRLYDAFLPLYIEGETNEFVKKVDELMDFKNNQEY